jgi:tetratricopeptide (TPR) repeat protein
MNLGVVLERQQKYDAAMDEFARAAERDENSADAHWGIGRIFLQRKNYAQAIGELRVAERLGPSSWKIHTTLADALAGNGDLKGAIAQVRQAQMLEPKNAFIMSALAPLLEKNGDIVGALEQYRRAADIARADKESGEYAAAQQRFTEKVRSLRAAGKNSEAAELETRGDSHAPDLESQWRDKMEASRRAMSEQRLEDAEKSAKEELALAEQLRPVDDRLLQSIFDIAWAYTLQKKFPQAQSEWQHQLTVSQKFFGPESQEAVHALDGLAGNSYLQEDYGAAVNFYARAIELNEKLFDATDPRVLNDLFWLASSYQAQGSFEKAEPILLRALQMNEAAGKATPLLEANMLQLGKLYLAWGKFDKAESYCRKSLDMREQWFGPNSPVLADPLQTLSDVLTRLGKSDEAALLRERHDTVMNAAAKTGAKP